MELLKSEILGNYAFLDPNSGKGTAVKRQSARAAIVVVSGDAFNRCFVREAWAKKATTDEMYDKIYEFNDRYKLEVFGIEGNAQQSLFVDSVIKDAAERRINIPIVNKTQPTNVPKEFRIRTRIHPALNNGRLFIKNEHKDLFDEIISFPMSTTVDLVDALASCIEMIPKRMTLRIKDDELDARLEYLRNTGAPPWYIAQIRDSGNHEADSESEIWKNVGYKNY